MVRLLCGMANSRYSREIQEDLQLGGLLLFQGRDPMSGDGDDDIFHICLLASLRFDFG